LEVVYRLLLYAMGLNYELCKAAKGRVMVSYEALAIGLTRLDLYNSQATVDNKEVRTVCEGHQAIRQHLLRR
jgi:hypothetical protein